MMIQIRNVHKKFGDLTVLDGIDLDVEKGDVIAILGPSGSGKTTFLRCLNFLERADSGTMVFDGESFDLGTARKQEIARIRKKTAFVFQNYNLFLNKTVLQNVTLGLTAGMGMKKEEASERAIRALEKVGMAEKLKSYPVQLSGGQQQRVAIARALAMDPEIIYFDQRAGSRTHRRGAGGDAAAGGGRNDHAGGDPRDEFRPERKQQSDVYGRRKGNRERTVERIL